MSAIVLVSGRLLRDPQKKVSAKGRPYGSALVRVSDGNDSALWRVTAFSETALAELMKLRVGDGIAATGPMQAELYTPAGGEPRLSLSLVADRLISMEKQKRARGAEAVVETTPSPRGASKGSLRESVHAPADFDDSGIPF